jgi:DNA-binding CsgD family transcriptional regulator
MRTAILGREDELHAIASFLVRAHQGAAALVLSGEAGMGKTTLWECAVAQAQERGDRVLAVRGAEAEATLSFAGLADLVADVLDEAGPVLLAPRRRALDVALLREEPAAAPLDPLAVGIAVLDVLRLVAESRPVLVAVDDLQWVDASTASVLQFAVRRLRDERVGFLATLRPGGGDALAGELERRLGTRALRLPLGPLDLHALHHLLNARLGLELTRPQLLRVREATGGNPFYALELGRELQTTGAPIVPGQPLPVPPALRGLVAERLARLPDEMREVLLTAAAMSRPSADALAAAHGDDARAALERAAAAGVVDVGGSSLRFAHPLLATVCYHDAAPWRRRAAHERIAAVTRDPEERARHLALAANAPDAAVAAGLDSAAGEAAARGATASAAELCELAAGVTPVVSARQRRRRLLRAAHLHRLSGDRDRARRMLERLLGDVPGGSERADVLFALASVRRGDITTITALCQAALDEASGDDARCAEITAFLSWMRLLEGNVPDALRQARAALERAERVHDPMLLARAIARVAMAESWSLEITPGLVERGVAIEETLEQPLEFHESPTTALARRLICMGDLGRARALLQRQEKAAAARGDEGTRGHLLFHLVVLEVFSGRFDRARSHADAALEVAEQLGDDQYRGMALYASASVEAHLGNADATAAAARQAVTIARAAADAIFPIWIAATLGHLCLSLADLHGADRHLRPLPDRLLALGWNDPADELWPDSIETLIGLGELGESRSRVRRYEQLAERSGSPWALAAAARCTGLLSAAEGDTSSAFAAFDRALTAHASVQSPFERGRTLLALGSVRRRARQKRPAREALEEARDIFDRAGATQWAQRARDELSRVSGRRHNETQLTETEQRVSSLAARGLSNKEIAAALFVRVHTVETHLSRVYRKLGVRSRTELAVRTADRAEDLKAKE